MKSIKFDSVAEALEVINEAKCYIIESKHYKEICDY